MTYTLDTPLSEAIAAAEKAGACEDDIDILRALNVTKMTIGDLAVRVKAPEWAYWFARYALKGRFEAGEVVIAKQAWCSYYYAKEVLRGRFEAGEAEIAASNCYTHYYSKLPGVPRNWRAQA